MKITAITIQDERISAIQDLGGFHALACECIEFAFKEKRNCGVLEMAKSSVHARAYCRRWNDYQVDIFFDLNTHDARLVCTYNRYLQRKEVSAL